MGTPVRVGSAGTSRVHVLLKSETDREGRPLTLCGRSSLRELPSLEANAYLTAMDRCWACAQRLKEKLLPMADSRSQIKVVAKTMPEPAAPVVPVLGPGGVHLARTHAGGAYDWHAQTTLCGKRVTATCAGFGEDECECRACRRLAAQIHDDAGDEEKAS